MLYSMDAVVNGCPVAVKSNTQSSLRSSYAPLSAVVGTRSAALKEPARVVAACTGIKVAAGHRLRCEGLLLEAIFGENPVIFIVEHRSLVYPRNRVRDGRIESGSGVLPCAESSESHDCRHGRHGPFALRVA